MLGTGAAPASATPLSLRAHLRNFTTCSCEERFALDGNIGTEKWFREFYSFARGGHISDNGVKGEHVQYRRQGGKTSRTKSLF